jgi:DNA-binding SARP family transcriptional activator
MNNEELGADIAQHAQPLLRVSLLGPLRLEWQVAPFTQEAIWSGRTSARALFLLLLFAPDRQASRSKLAGILWPETEENKALESLRSALKVLRKVLSTAGGEVLIETTKSDLLKLADQSRLWVDIDAFETLIEQANQQPEVLSLWQQASTYWQGELLAEDKRHEWVTHPWITVRRKKLQAARRRMIRHLAQGYLLAGQRARAEAVLSTHIATFPTDQDALYLLMKLLIEEGCFDEARSYYEHCQRTLARYEKQPAKHLQMLEAHLNAIDITTIVPELQYEQARVVVSTVRPIATDLVKYEKNIRLALHIHRTSNAQSLLQDIANDLDDLEGIEDQVKGDVLSYVRTLLIGNHLLAAKIVKDQKRYNLAYIYANTAVRVAKLLGNDTLIATARYTRGCTKLEWGLFGTIEQGRFQQDHKKIQNALADFEAILLLSHRQPALLHPQLLGSTQLQWSRAQQALSSALSSHREDNESLQLVDQASETVGQDHIEDPYMRMMMTGTLSGLHRGGYLLVKAGILNLAGSSEQALTNLSYLTRLTEQTYGQDETRYQAWSVITMAEAFLELGEYQEALLKAKTALIACYHIHSLQNITMIADLYHRLLASSYRTSLQVHELGDMLHEWYGMERNEYRLM